MGYRSYGVSGFLLLPPLARKMDQKQYRGKFADSSVSLTYGEVSVTTNHSAGQFRKPEVLPSVTDVHVAPILSSSPPVAASTRKPRTPPCHLFPSLPLLHSSCPLAERRGCRR